jgi:predicted Holliday junction resolvase-like endonuclease
MKKHLVSTILSCLLLVLVLVNILLGFGNQSLQSEVAERQQEIAHGMQLEALQRQVVSVLADMAAKTNDAQLKDLLAKSGFGMSPNPEPGPVKGSK